MTHWPRSIISLFLVVSVVCVFGVGCGKSAPTIPDAEIKAAVAPYLSAKSMRMEITEIRDVKVEGDTAVAVCKMKDTEGLYNLAITWQFTLARQDGKWRATGHLQN
jgi:hypothetical protein